MLVYILAMIFILTHFLFFLVGLDKVITRYYVGLPFKVTQSLMMILAMSLYWYCQTIRLFFNNFNQKNKVYYKA